MSADSRRPPGSDDDETTSSRGKPPRAPIVPAQVPDRPTIPQLGRVPTRRGVDVAKARAGEPDPLDDGPTTYDPGLPAGMREPAPMSEEQRATQPRPAARPIHDEDEPTGAKAPLATVVGKRAVKPTVKGASKSVDPREAPTAQHQRPPTGKTPHVKQVDPREAPTAQHPRPATQQAPVRLDDSARTNRWDAAEPQDGPGHRDSGPPTNPLPGGNLPLAPGPASNAAFDRPLPLAPGPRSAQIHAVSMKSAHEVDEDRSARPLPEVRIRAMSELNQTPSRGMGYLAPPHDPGAERSRRRRDLVIWGSVAVIVAAVVTLVVWFVAR